jgi:hypothetical protein
MSIINIVLVFGKLPYFVRKILQGEENKGVELTVRSCNRLNISGISRARVPGEKSKKPGEKPSPEAPGVEHFWSYQLHLDASLRVFRDVNRISYALKRNPIVSKEIERSVQSRAVNF